MWYYTNHVSLHSIRASLHVKLCIFKNHLKSEQLTVRILHKPCEGIDAERGRANKQWSNWVNIVVYSREPVKCCLLMLLITNWPPSVWKSLWTLCIVAICRLQLDLVLGYKRLCCLFPNNMFAKKISKLTGEYQSYSYNMNWNTVYL